MTLELADDLGRRDVAGNDDQRVARLVIRVVEGDEIFPRNCAQRRRRRHMAVGVRTVHAGGEYARGELRGLAELHLQVGQRALALRLELVSREGRVDQHVRSGGHGDVDVGFQRSDREAGPIRSGIGGGLRAHAIEGLRDLQ